MCSKVNRGCKAVCLDKEMLCYITANPSNFSPGRNYGTILRVKWDNKDSFDPKIQVVVRFPCMASIEFFFYGGMTLLNYCCQ